jgi:hypothetical protein
MAAGWTHAAHGEALFVWQEAWRRIRCSQFTHTHPPLTYACVQCEHTMRSSFIYSLMLFVGGAPHTSTAELKRVHQGIACSRELRQLPLRTTSRACCFHSADTCTALLYCPRSTRVVVLQVLPIH